MTGWMMVVFTGMRRMREKQLWREKSRVWLCESPQMCSTNRVLGTSPRGKATAVTLRRGRLLSQIYRDLKGIPKKHLFDSKVTPESPDCWLIGTNGPSFPERQNTSISSTNDISDFQSGPGPTLTLASAVLLEASPPVVCDGGKFNSR